MRRGGEGSTQNVPVADMVAQDKQQPCAESVTLNFGQPFVRRQKFSIEIICAIDVWGKV
jgi:hypothetical protein